MDRDDVTKAVLQVMETVLELELRAVRQALGEEPVESARPRRQGSRRQSIVDQSVQILTDEKRAMHVSELVGFLRQRFGRVTDRDTLSSALAKKARQGVLLRQTAAATFGLLEVEA
jgi:hypothetical protein